MSSVSVEDVAKRHGAELKKLENVVDVGVGATVPDYEAGQPSVIVYVGGLSSSLQKTIPANLEGFRVQAVIKAVQGNVEVYFSPQGGCVRELISEIDKAERSVHCAIFSFTLGQVADAVIKAKERGTAVNIVFDRHQTTQKTNQEIYERLRAADVEVLKSANKALMHNKYAVIDRKTVVTGSFDWTTSAETRNNENLVTIHLPKIAKAFEEEYKRLWNWHVDFYTRAKVKFTGRTLVYLKGSLSS